jgi:hypothetical protein
VIHHAQTVQTPIFIGVYTQDFPTIIHYRTTIIHYRITVQAAATTETVITVGPAAHCMVSTVEILHTIHMCRSATVEIDTDQIWQYNIHMFKTFTTIIAAITVTGCANMEPGCYRDHRDRPYDPCRGSSLLEQFPNWDSRLTIHDAQQGPAARDIVIINR